MKGTYSYMCYITNKGIYTRTGIYIGHVTLHIRICKF